MVEEVEEAHSFRSTWAAAVEVRLGVVEVAGEGEVFHFKEARGGERGRVRSTIVLRRILGVSLLLVERIAEAPSSWRHESSCE